MIPREEVYFLTDEKIDDTILTSLQKAGGQLSEHAIGFCVQWRDDMQHFMNMEESILSGDMDVVISEGEYKFSLTEKGKTKAESILKRVKSEVLPGGR